MKITFLLFLKYWFLLTCLVNCICIYIWLILILWLFLFVQLSNQPLIVKTYLNRSICLCSIHSKRLSCINVESCFWKCLSFISYVINVLWNKWNRNKKKKRDSYSIFLNFWMKPLLKNHDFISFISLTKSVSKEHPTQPAQHIWCNILLYILYTYIYIYIYIYKHIYIYI